MHPSVQYHRSAVHEDIQLRLFATISLRTTYGDLACSMESTQKIQQYAGSTNTDSA